MAKLNKDIRITNQELSLLELINRLGPCSSEKVHESGDTQFDYLIVLRTLHRLVEKGFLQRIVINHKRLYKTSRSYSHIRTLLRDAT